MPQIVVDGRDQVRDALEGPAANPVAGDFAEPTLHQIQPGAIGGNEMKVHAAMAAKPALDGRTLVRAQIVEHDMNGFVRGCRALEAIEKPHELFGIALRTARAEHGPIQDAQRRIQTGRPVADVIVRLSFGHLAHERQHWARPIQGLNATLLVDAKHDGLVGRIEIQAHDIAQFVDEPRILGQFKAGHPMRLQAVLMPDAPDRALTDALRLAHRARAPVRRRWWLGPQRRLDNGRDLLRRNPFPTARPRRIVQHRAHAAGHVAPHPVMDVIPAQRQSRGNVGGADAIGQHQQNARADSQLLGRVAIRHDLRQLRAVRRGQRHAECGHEHATPYRFASPKYSEFMY